MAVPTSLKKAIFHHQAMIASRLPVLEKEVEYLIADKITNEQQIEWMLDSLLSLVSAGVDESLFFKLCDYYESVNVEGAAFYRKEYREWYL
jgi:hypothetical protein